MARQKTKKEIHPRNETIMTLSHHLQDHTQRSSQQQCNDFQHIIQARDRKTVTNTNI